MLDYYTTSCIKLVHDLIIAVWHGTITFFVLFFIFNGFLFFLGWFTICITIICGFSNKGCTTVQYSTVQYSTVQYSTVQYSTVQYSTRILLIATYMYNHVQQKIKFKNECEEKPLRVRGNQQSFFLKKAKPCCSLIHVHVHHVCNGKA